MMRAAFPGGPHVRTVNSGPRAASSLASSTTHFSPPLPRSMFSLTARSILLRSRLDVRHFAIGAGRPGGPPGQRPPPGFGSPSPPGSRPPPPPGTPGGPPGHHPPHSALPHGILGAGPSSPLDEPIVELNLQTFQELIMYSDTPVIIDCYADWCEPCKQVTPHLENAVLAARGTLRLGKVNVDRYPEIAQALRVGSIPFVIAFLQGQPIDAFTGMKTPQGIKEWVDSVLYKAGATSSAALLQLAANKLEEGNIPEATQIYSSVLTNPKWKAEAQALAGLARCALAEGNTELAAELVSKIEKSYSKDIDEKPDVRQAVTAVRLALEAKGRVPADVSALKERLSKDPDDHQARFDLALVHMNSGRTQLAIDELLNIVKRDRHWNDDAARKMLLKIFESLGPNNEMTVKGRQRLTAMLFI